MDNVETDFVPYQALLVLVTYPDITPIHHMRAIKYLHGNTDKARDGIPPLFDCRCASPNKIVKNYVNKYGHEPELFIREMCNPLTKLKK
jgi:hypothetical protein